MKIKRKDWKTIIDVNFILFYDGVREIGQFIIIFFSGFFRKFCELHKKFYFTVDFIKAKVSSVCFKQENKAGKKKNDE